LIAQRGWAGEAGHPAKPEDVHIEVLNILPVTLLGLIPVSDKRSIPIKRVQEET